MGQPESVEQLILLVGSNPLPNYLAAMALKPSTVYLVHSDETKRPKDRLDTALREDLGLSVTIDGDAYVDDPFSASAVGDKIRDLMTKCKTSHLHYTGGTKVMSAHALKAFYKQGGQEENASYLDETQALLRFDGNRSSRSLSDCGLALTLERILQLHGVTQKTRSEVDGGPGQNDVQAIATAVLRRPQLASCLYGEKKRLEAGTLKEAKETPLNPSDYELTLTASIIPTEQMKSKCSEVWYNFIGGEWLEEWVASKVRDLALAGNPEIKTGINCKRSDPHGKFEVDVAVIRGQRSYFISCTTDMTRSMCKSKAFEVMARSRHMGGDLARSALVSLLPTDIVADLRDDVASAWASSNTTRIFGLEDMRHWAGHNGSPDLTSLKNWLEPQ